MDDSGPLSTTLCPRCGVPVAPGYPKCPRCHAEQPGPRARPRARTDGGGTSVGPGADRTLLYLGLGVVAIIALTVWLLTRDDGSPTAVALGPDGGSDDLAEPLAVEGGDDGNSPEPGPDRTPTPPVQGQGPTGGAADRGAAVGALGRALRAERMWATVTADGEFVVIDSSLCDDPALAAIVDASAGDLRAAALTTVRCRAPHGGIVFEHGL